MPPDPTANRDAVLQLAEALRAARFDPDDAADDVLDLAWEFDRAVCRCNETAEGRRFLERLIIADEYPELRRWLVALYPEGEPPTPDFVAFYRRRMLDWPERDAADALHSLGIWKVVITEDEEQRLRARGMGRIDAVLLDYNARLERGDWQGAIREALGDPRAVVRVWAIDATVDYGVPGLEARIQQMVGDPDGFVVWTAWHALGNFAMWRDSDGKDVQCDREARP